MHDTALAPESRNTDDTRPALRFITCGSVDDGKSTLIGRLLLDSRSVLQDQLASVTRSGEVDLALFTDGLSAEREQGITIDVAYRYFATPTRTFILADTPGHVQYTRNTVTGASTADLVVILTDARTGVVAQTRRHAAVAALLGVPHLLLAVNKIDLVDYDQGVFDAIASEFSAYAKGLGIHEITSIPISALNGDNVVTRSERIDWYDGPSVLEHLETVDLAADTDEALRFPVQYVIRPRSDELPDYRGYAGRVGVYELLEMDEPMIAALRRSDPQGFAEAAKANPHYRPLAACALDYALAGVTSVEEVLKVCATLTDEVLA